ncbi:MAG: DUF5606 domain-containing protein [Flavobacteriaceae bacterium]|nr:DUF5606 domain-containing protein [Flavobacteriaceae bacterium]
MQLDKIISIGGRPGLYEVSLQTRTGVVATSLVDGKRITASMRDQVSVLSEINIYGLEKEVPLREIFKMIHAKEEGKTCSVKPKAAADQLEAFFFDVFQDYDEERVYPPDIKKVIQWYNILIEKAPEIFTEEAPATDAAADKEDE